MNGSLKVCKALLWKQSCESLWILVPAFLATVFLTIAPIYSFFPLSNPDDSLNHLFQTYYIIGGLLGLILAAFFFIPLYAVEAERKTLTFLATKPIPSEWIASLSALYAGLMAALLLIFSNLLFFTVTYYLFPLHRAFPNLTQFQTYFYNLSLSLLILYGFGCFFLLVSASASTRFRSLGIAMIGFFACLTGIEVYYGFWMEMQDEYPMIFPLFSRIDYVITISPVSLVVTGCALFVPLAFAVFRMRMVRGLYFWQRYAVVETGFLILFLSVFAFVLPNRNLSQLNITQDSLGPESQQFLQSICATQQEKQQERKGKALIRDRFAFVFEGAAGNVYPDETIQPVRLKIFKTDRKLQSVAVFDKTMLDCFSIESLNDGNIHPKDKAFFRRDDWDLMLAENSGVVQGKIDSRPSILGYGKDGNPIQTQLSIFEWVFLGHFRLDDTIQYTPVKRCIFHYIGPNGKETATVECVHPGVFSQTDFSDLYKPLHAESKRRMDMKLPGILEDFSLDANIWGADYSILRLTGWFSNSTELDHFEGNRLYAMDYHQDRNGRFWPVIDCYDFSDPETITVYSGTLHKDEYPLGELNPYYFGAHPNPNYFVVDGNRLIHAISNFNRDTLVAFDVSDPGNIREIGRRTYSKWARWGNWDIAPPMRTSAGMRLDRGKYLIQSSLGVYLYDLQDDLSLRRVARKTQWEKGRGIDSARITDGRLSVAANGRFHQFAIGNDIPGDTADRGLPYLAIQGQARRMP